MEKLDNKLLADYASNHIVMVYPAMHKNFLHFEDMKKIYSEVSMILSSNNIHQSFIVPKEYNNDVNFFNNLNPNIKIIKYDCNDIWIRDYYPKLYSSNEGLEKIDFDFNGYGEKYPFENDNNYKYTLDMYNSHFNFKGYIIEGGNLEFSSKGIVLTNKNSFNKRHCN